MSAPGTILISSPNTANGRRSTCRGASEPSGIAVGTVDSATVCCAIHRSGASARTSFCASICSSVASGPMNTPLPPDSPVGLTTSSWRRSSTYSRCSGSARSQVGQVVEDRLLAQVEADHLGDVVVDRLVVGHSRAERVRDPHVPGPVRAHQPGHAEQRVRPELERVDEIVVDAAVDRVDAREAAGGAHVDRRRRARRGRTPPPARRPSAGRGRRARSRRCSRTPASTRPPPGSRRRSGAEALSASSRRAG